MYSLNHRVEFYIISNIHILFIKRKEWCKHYLRRTWFLAIDSAAWFSHSLICLSSEAWCSLSALISFRAAIISSWSMSVWCLVSSWSPSRRWRFSVFTWQIAVNFRIQLIDIRDWSTWQEMRRTITGRALSSEPPLLMLWKPLSIPKGGRCPCCWLHICSSSPHAGIGFGKSYLAAGFWPTGGVYLWIWFCIVWILFRILFNPHIIPLTMEVGISMWRISFHKVHTRN